MTDEPTQPDRFVIAIDGPAAAGKSTVAGLVADALSAVVFDTGILYRAVTLAAVEKGVDASDGEHLAQIATNIDVEVRPPSVDDGRIADIYFRGRDVTWQLRSPEVDRVLSTISALPEVRSALLEPQRRIGRSGRVVVVGRDIGTVVIPDADLKIYLEASPDERARRRYRELAESGNEQPFDDVLQAMIRRDRLDSERALAPLVPAEDAIIIDSDSVLAVDVASRIVNEFQRVHGTTGRAPDSERSTQ